MAKKIDKLGSARRFGARYGRKIKQKVASVEKQKKGLKCPFCLKQKLKRKASGIWECKKCEKIFTGKAYSI